MLRVFFTVDVEVWCDGWHDLDRRFPDALARRIYGATTHGNYGLPAILALLNDHGLAGVFFVEPLFAMRFGQDFLDEVVGLVTAAFRAARGIVASDIPLLAIIFSRRWRTYCLVASLGLQPSINTRGVRRCWLSVFASIGPQDNCAPRPGLARFAMARAGAALNLGPREHL